MKIFLPLFFLLQSTSLFAQDSPIKLTSEVKQAVIQADQSSEKEDYQKALAAKQKGEFEKALILLKQAYEKDNNALYLFERALVLEQMDEKELALRVLDENMEAIKNHPDVSELAMTRERIAGMKSSDVKDVDSSDSNLVGPILIGTGAVAIITGAILIVISHANADDAKCHVNVRNPGCDNPTGKARPSDIQDELDSANLLNLAGFGVGAAGLLLTGVGFTLTW